MANLSSNDDDINCLKTQNNFQKLNVFQKSDENFPNNSMLNLMADLITTMNQLQKMFIEQMSNHQNINKNIPPKSSQTELLLKQVQTAMESTIAQLSIRDPPLNNIDPSTNKMADTQLSISQKWRLYTEMYQLKNETSKDYCLNKMKLGQELGLTFKETKREMLIGLWSNRLSIVLYLKPHETEDDLLRDIEEWERIENARNEVFKKYRHKRF